MNALVVGGSSGIGLSITITLLERFDVETIYVIDKNPYPKEYWCDKIYYQQWDLTHIEDREVLDKIDDIQMLYITAGFGHLRHFQDFDNAYIESSFLVNAVCPIEIIRHYYQRILGQTDFYCAVMVSIAGRLNSPMFAIYSATKAALSKCIEAINVELEMQNSENRILEVSPGSLKGTSFAGGKTDPSQTGELAAEIISRSLKRDLLFIPQYEEVFKDVLERYEKNAHKFGLESYLYKQKRL